LISRKIPLAIACFVFLLLATSVYAASSTFLQQATNYYQQNCLKTKISDSTALSCYLFDKVKELDTGLVGLGSRMNSVENDNYSQSTQINNLQVGTASQAAEITNLKNRVSALENGQTPAPSDFVFFNNQEVPLQGFVFSQTFDAGGFSKIVFTFQCYEQGTTLLLLVSNDNINKAATYTVNPDQCHQGGSITLDVAGKYYSTYIGNNTNIVNPRPSVYAIGHFK
jgi:hypothetical protein